MKYTITDLQYWGTSELIEEIIELNKQLKISKSIQAVNESIKYTYKDDNTTPEELFSSFAQAIKEEQGV
jgi:hypothetical protein